MELTSNNALDTRPVSRVFVITTSITLNIVWQCIFIGQLYPWPRSDIRRNDADVFMHGRECGVEARYAWPGNDK